MIVICFLNSSYISQVIFRIKSRFDLLYIKFFSNGSRMLVCLFIYTTILHNVLLTNSQKPSIQWRSQTFRFRWGRGEGELEIKKLGKILGGGGGGAHRSSRNFENFHVKI